MKHMELMLKVAICQLNESPIVQCDQAFILKWSSGSEYAFKTLRAMRDIICSERWLTITAELHMQAISREILSSAILTKWHARNVIILTICSQLIIQNHPDSSNWPHNPDQIPMHALALKVPSVLRNLYSWILQSCLRTHGYYFKFLENLGVQSMIV